MPLDLLPYLIEEFLRAAEAGNLETIKECINRGVCPKSQTASGLNALHCASGYGHLEIVQYLIETCHVDTKAKNNEGWVALHFAFSKGHLEIVKYLIETCHLHTAIEDNDGCDALHFASYNGHLNIVQYLIETCHVDTKAKTNEGNTALHIATDNGHLEIVQYLIESCHVEKEAKGNDGWVALHFASSNGHLEIVQYLIETCHVDTKALHLASSNGHLVIVQYLIETCQVDNEAKDNDGFTALHFACSNGHLEIVQYLINRCHADTEAKDNEGLVGLHIAASNGHLEIVQYLIETCHVDVEAKENNGSVALHFASYKGHLKIVQCLIEKCHADTEAKDTGGLASLHYAAISGHVDIVQYLSETCHVDTTAKSNDGWVALHSASYNGHLEIVQYLIEKCHVNMVETDMYGRISLHFASTSGHLNVVQYLIEKCHVDKNAKDIGGWTALHFAASDVDSHLDVVKHLIETWRLDPEIKGHDGWTVLHHASSNGHFDIVKYLIDNVRVEKEAKDCDGLTALHHSADGGYLEIVTYLIEDCKVDMLARDNAGRTAYDLSLISGNADIANYFHQRLDEERSDQSMLSNINPDGLALIPVNQPSVPLYTNGKVELNRNSVDDVSDCMSRLIISSAQSSLWGCSSNDWREHLNYFRKLVRKTRSCQSTGASLSHITDKLMAKIFSICSDQASTSTQRSDMRSLLSMFTGESMLGMTLSLDFAHTIPIHAATQSNVQYSKEQLQETRSCQSTGASSHIREILKGILFPVHSHQSTLSINISDSSSIPSMDIVDSILETTRSVNFPDLGSILSLSDGAIPTDTNTKRNVTPTRNSSNELPNIHSFPDVYTIDELPWYAVVIGSQDSKTSGLKESLTYRDIRNHSKYIPLEVLYYKLLQTYKRPEYIQKHQKIPTHEDQLLFVYVDNGVFRPIHWKAIGEPANSLSPRGKTDFLVAADIKNNGGRIRLSSDEKKEHVEILIQLKRRDLDSIVPELPYRQIVSRTLAAIEGVIAEVAGDEDFTTHNAQIRETWELYFPSPERNRKRKSVPLAIVGNLVTPANSSNELPNIHNFQDEYTKDDLPWYAVVIGSNEKQYCQLGASLTYRSIRDRSKFIPVEILLYKLLQILQEPEYINNLDVVPTHVPTHEDQLLFVYVDNGIFRPIHRTEGMDNTLSPRQKRDSLVAADIKKNGGKCKLSVLPEEDKKDHLVILIRIMHRALDSVETKVSYRQIVSRTLDVIEEVITGDVDNADIEKHETQIKNTWQRYVPTPKPNRKKPKLADSNND